MRYATRDKYVAELRELADFLEQHGHKLPENTWYTTTMQISLTATDYEKNPESGEYESTINEEKTKHNLKKFLDAVGACEKDYREDSIKVWKNFASTGNTMIRGTVDRSIACKRVVTGKKLVPATLIQARIEEEVEWVCDEGLSLLKLVQ